MATLMPGRRLRQGCRRSRSRYDEGLKVGYKWYDAEQKQV